jgi:hypothetical protein
MTDILIWIATTLLVCNFLLSFYIFLIDLICGLVTKKKQVWMAVFGFYLIYRAVRELKWYYKAYKKLK